MYLPANSPFAQRFRDSVAPALLGGCAAAIALAPTITAKLILLGLLCGGALLSWIFYRPSRWLYVFFFSLLALPPLPAANGGDSGIHVAPVAAAIGLLIGLMRLQMWRKLRGSLALAFIVFVTILLMSTGFAAFYSGIQIAIGSLARVFLFSLGVYVFAYTLAGGPEESPDPVKFARFLFWLATGVVVFACCDFYFQFPAPAGYGPQFVWVGEDVIRRAQGLFYEASTLGNFCAFFLVLILVCLFHPKSDIPVSKPVLGAAGAVFATAMIFSYSRGSLVNLICAAGALAWLRRGSVRLKRGRALMALICLTLAAGIAVQTLLPSFSANYWSRITGTIQSISSSPDSVLSGRLTSWNFLSDFLQRQPWTAIFGIGYKTLPYSDYAGATVVADNTYLQLLVETGIIGLVSFLALNAAILRTGLRAARSPRPTGRIFGEWIFCFWIGQAVQMLSGDLITYWRVLPVYFWVLAIAAREARRTA
jgi:O-antigen ligase